MDLDCLENIMNHYGRRTPDSIFEDNRKRMLGFKLINKYDLPEAILLTKHAVADERLRPAYIDAVFEKIKNVKQFCEERPNDRMELYRLWMRISEIDCENLLDREIYDALLIEKLSE